MDARRKGIFARNFNVVYDVSGEMGGGVRARERAHLVFVLCSIVARSKPLFYQKALTPTPTMASTAPQYADPHQQLFVDKMTAVLHRAMRDAPHGLTMYGYWELVAPQLAVPRDLWAAVAAGNADAARAFLAKPDVDVNAYDADGATPTYIAAAHGHAAMVELLLDEGGADISKATPDDAKALLVESWRIAPPAQEDRDRPDGGACPLYIAARNGRADAVRALVERGADVNRSKCTLPY